MWFVDYSCTHACTHILICTCACKCTHAHTHAHNYNIQLAKSTHRSCFLLLQLQCISSHYVLPLVLSDGWLVFALFPVVHLPSWLCSFCSLSFSSTFLPLLASSALLSGAFALLSPVFALLELFFALPSSVLLASFFLLSLQEV